MTCIVGIEHNDCVYMGCDSAASDDAFRFATMVDTKVFSNGNMLMGMCGTFRLGQLLKHALDIPDHDPRTDDMKWLCTTYVDAVRTMLDDKGHIIKGEHVVEEIENGDYLMGYNGKLYLVEANFQVLRAADGYMATGCGCDLALGALHCMMSNGKINNPVKLVEEALKAASHHSAACAPPHHVFKLDSEGKTTKVL